MLACKISWPLLRWRIAGKWSKCWNADRRAESCYRRICGTNWTLSDLCQDNYGPSGSMWTTCRQNIDCLKRKDPLAWRWLSIAIFNWRYVRPEHRWPPTIRIPQCTCRRLHLGNPKGGWILLRRSTTGIAGSNPFSSVMLFVSIVGGDPRWKSPSKCVIE